MPFAETWMDLEICHTVWSKSDEKECIICYWGQVGGGIVREFGVDLLFIHSVMSDSFWTPWTVACPAPLSMGFSRQEHWSGLPFPSPGNLPVPWTESMTPALQTDPLPLSLLGRLPLYLKWITNKVFLCIAQGTLLDVCPAWVGRQCGEKGYTYMRGWVPSRFTWNSQRC